MQTVFTVIHIHPHNTHTNMNKLTENLIIYDFWVKCENNVVSESSTASPKLMFHLSPYSFSTKMLDNYIMCVCVCVRPSTCALCKFTAFVFHLFV